MTTPTHWRVPPCAKLSWRRWPDESEYVFYHGATGDTHRLSELAGMIMERALAGPVDTAALMQWLLVQGDAAPEATLDQVFTSLSQLDFIEPLKTGPGNATG
ncbi:MAG: HPr-rel-A system PqqD family peptide chaperone [Thiobacillus sp.]